MNAREAEARAIERADAKLHGWRWLLKWRKAYRANLGRVLANMQVSHTAGK